MSRRDFPSRMIFTSSEGDDDERDFAVAGAWSPRCYACSFCGRDFKSAQALGGHMNIHRRDRARLRTSTSSLPSVSHMHHADFAPAPPESAHSTLYLPFEAAACTHHNPSSICTTLNTHPPPTIISASPTFKPLLMRSLADPALLAMAATPENENSSSSFSAPISDRSPSKIQNGAHALFPNIAPQPSSLLIRPMLDNSSKTAGAYTAPQFKARNKRARGNDLDAVKISSEDKSTVQRWPSSTENSAAAPRSCAVRPTDDLVYKDRKELNCLDLELRLGQSPGN